MAGRCGLEDAVPLRPMPRREICGFLERCRARRAPVAAGPERGGAPRGLAAAERSRYVCRST